MYHQYQKEIWKYLLPPYIIHLLTVTLGIHLAEIARDSHKASKNSEEDMFSMVSQNNETIEKFFLHKICLSSQGIITLLNLFIFCKQSKHLGFSILHRKWSVIDFAIISLNIFTVSGLFVNIELKLMRIFEAFLVILIYLKSLYFLRLVG